MNDGPMAMADRLNQYVDELLRGASYCLHVEEPSGGIFFEVMSLGCGL